MGIYISQLIGESPGGDVSQRIVSVAEMPVSILNAAMEDENGVAYTVTAPTLNALAGGTASSLTLAGNLSTSKTLTAATISAADRLVRSELTITPSTNVAITGGASVAAIRGNATVTTGHEVTDGFIYGVQGKFVGDGATISVGSGHIAAVLAQMSGASMVATDGHIAPLIVSGQNLPTSANVNMIYCESGGGKVNAILQSNVKATYAFDINNFESGGLIAAAGTGGGSAGASGGAVATKVLVCLIDGVAAYIPLCSTNA